MIEKKFDSHKLEKLNDPRRLEDIPPDYIAEKLPVLNPEIIIEIGSGTAFFCKAFLKKYKPSKLYACDIFDVMIHWVRDNVSTQYPEIIPLKTEENTIPLNDGIASLVFMINLHHELENPMLIMKEAYRLLKSDGSIFIVDWKKEDMPEGPPVSIRCLPKEVKTQMEKTGFTNTTVYNDLKKHFLIVGKK